MKKLFALMLASVMTVSLVACGGGNSNNNAGGSESKSDASSTSSSSTAEGDTQEVADLSGDLVVYSSAPEADNNSIIDGFGQLYPNINIEIVQGNQGTGIARVEAEADNPSIDVFYTGINDTDGDKYKDLFEQYVSPFNSDLADMYQSNGYYNYNIVSTCCICVNRDLAAELGVEITGYESLTDPALKGKVIFSNPTASSAAWNNMCTIFANYGYDSDKSWDLVDRLLANGLIVTDSSSQCFNDVQTGEYVAGITYEGGPIDLLSNGATNIDIVYPIEGTGGSIFGSAIIKNAKNMDNAKALVDWLTSKEGQQTQLDMGSPQRKIADGLDFSATYIPTLDRPLVARDMEWLIANKEAMLEKWTELYSKYN